MDLLWNFQSPFNMSHIYTLKPSVFKTDTTETDLIRLSPITITVEDASWTDRHFYSRLKRILKPQIALQLSTQMDQVCLHKIKFRLMAYNKNNNSNQIQSLFFDQMPEYSSIQIPQRGHPIALLLNYN